jgi:hypothetical protein
MVSRSISTSSLAKDRIAAFSSARPLLALAVAALLTAPVGS